MMQKRALSPRSGLPKRLLVRKNTRMWALFNNPLYPKYSSTNRSDSNPHSRGEPRFPHPADSLGELVRAGNHRFGISLAKSQMSFGEDYRVVFTGITHDPESPKRHFSPAANLETFCSCDALSQYQEKQSQLSQVQRDFSLIRLHWGPSAEVLAIAPPDPCAPAGA